MNTVESAPVAGMPIQIQPDWKAAPTVGQLKMDYDAGKIAHGVTMTKIQRWRDLHSVTGTQAVKKTKGRSSVQPKLVRRQAEWRYAALSEPLLNNPKLYDVQPATFEDGPKARQAGLVLNHQFRTQMNRVKLVDDLVRAMVDEGTFIAMVGWDRVTATIQKPMPVYDVYPVASAEEAEALQQALDLAASDPRGFEESSTPEMQEAVRYFNENGGVPVTAVMTGEVMIDEEVVVVNRPTVEVLNPDNVIIDPSCGGDLDKAMFGIRTFETCYADLVKKPDMYFNLDHIDWEGAGPVTNPDHATQTPSDFQFTDKGRKKVVAYEYWGYYDITGDGTLTPIVATWIGNVMIRLQESPFPDEKIPFVVAPYLPVKRELFGEADAEVLEDNQKISGAVVRGLVDSLGRSANAQQGFAKGMLDPVNRRRFDDGRDYEYNPTINPNIGLLQHKYPDIPQSALMMLNLQNQDAESLTGTKAFSGGLSGDSYGKVATGIRGALDASAKREMSILRRLAEGMRQIGLKIISMNGEFLSNKETVRITNQEFVEVLRDDLIGNFDLVVDISTAEMDASKASDLAFILQTIGPNADQSMVMKILAAIVDLKNMPDLAEEIRRWQPPEPTEQQMQMMQLEMEEKQAKIELTRANAELARAQARFAGSRSQSQDLDTLREATGQKHAEAVASQQAQSKGNRELEITKALGKTTKEGESKPNVEAMVGYDQLAG